MFSAGVCVECIHHSPVKRVLKCVLVGAVCGKPTQGVRRVLSHSLIIHSIGSNTLVICLHVENVQ